MMSDEAEEGIEEHDEQATGRVTVRRRCFVTPGSAQRQGEPEGRALSRNTLDPHLPLVLLDDGPGDG